MIYDPPFLVELLTLYWVRISPKLENQLISQDPYWDKTAWLTFEAYVRGIQYMCFNPPVGLTKKGKDWNPVYIVKASATLWEINIIVFMDHKLIEELLLTVSEHMDKSGIRQNCMKQKNQFLKTFSLKQSLELLNHWLISLLIELKFGIWKHDLKGRYKFRQRCISLFWRCYNFLMVSFSVFK